MTNTVDGWTADHAKAFRDFLQTSPGVLLIEGLRLAVGIPADGTAGADRTLVSAGEVRGRAQILGLLLAHQLVGTTVAAVESSYPDLDDDNKWPATR